MTIKGALIAVDLPCPPPEKKKNKEDGEGRASSEEDKQGERKGLQM